MKDKAITDVEMLVKDHIIVKQAVWLFVIFADMSVKDHIKDDSVREKFSKELWKLSKITGEF